MVPLNTMLSRAYSSSNLIDATNEEILAANYGRAGIHALVELSPDINQRSSKSAYMLLSLVSF